MTASLRAAGPADRRPARKPIIGITPSFDRECDRPLISGRPLLYVTQENVRAIRAAGGHAVILPTCLDDEDDLLDQLDGLLVTGTETPLPRRLRQREQLPGLREQNPERYDSDSRWLRGALARRMPVLAICHGMQMLNDILGGSLWPRI
ncbi:gamma-glutamyl-gamma-aminobutyrate hydrolase family protein, partial [Symbiobacterium thermophilum]